MSAPRARRAAALCAVVLALTAGAAAQDPDPAIARSNELRKQAYAAELAGDHQRAAEAFLELTELEADNPSWFVRASDNLGKVGRFNDAMTLLEGVRGHFPDVPDLSIALARIYHLKADTMRADGIRDINVTFYYNDAARVAETVLDADPKHLEANLLIASAQFQLGDVDSALERARAVASDHPGAYGGHAMVGRISFQRYVAAQQRMNDARPTGRDKAELIAEINQHRKEAESSFRAAHEADADRAFPLVKLGDLAAWSGRIGPALDSYRQALIIDPRAQIDHVWLKSAVDADKLLALYEGALEGYRARADATETGQGTLVWYVARVHYDESDWKRARELFETTLVTLPEHSDTYYYLMQSAFWGGAPDDSAEYAKTFARLAPRRFADMVRGDGQVLAVLKGLAAQSFAAGRLEESRDLNHVLAFALQTADEWNNYAFLCRETEAYERSLAGYREALALEPDSPQLINDAAVILQYHLVSEENRERARQMYEQAIEKAREQLAGGELGPEQRARAEKAISDARLNLEAMRKER